MHIVFDNIIFSLQRSGGGSRVWANIIQPHLLETDTISIERPDAIGNLYRKELFSPVIRPDHALPLRLARYCNFNQDFVKSAPYIFHSSYFRVNTSRNCINVTTVHDMVYEKYSSGLGAWIHNRQKKYALQNSDVIVCISEHTKQDLLQFYPFCSGKHLLVIPNGVDQRTFMVANSYETKFAPRPYFLYIGHRAYLKGFHIVFDALDRISEEFECVVVGSPFTDKEVALINKRTLGNRIKNIGRISDTELASYYSNASFFFFPSLYEGFGIPPLEAMAARCPVVAANRSSIPEVVGEAAILFDPDDFQSLESALKRVQDDSIRQDLIQKGVERLSHFTSQSSASAYTELYKELLA